MPAYMMNCPGGAVIVPVPSLSAPPNRGRTAPPSACRDRDFPRAQTRGTCGGRDPLAERVERARACTISVHSGLRENQKSGFGH